MCVTHAQPQAAAYKNRVSARVWLRVSGACTGHMWYPLTSPDLLRAALLSGVSSCVAQTSAMYLPWPQSAIMLLPSCREVVDSTGRLVFRGPRIKMGVCECSLLCCFLACALCVGSARLLPKCCRTIHS